MFYADFTASTWKEDWLVARRFGTFIFDVTAERTTRNATLLLYLQFDFNFKFSYFYWHLRDTIILVDYTLTGCLKGVTLFCIIKLFPTTSSLAVLLCALRLLAFVFDDGRTEFIQYYFKQLLLLIVLFYADNSFSSSL